MFKDNLVSARKMHGFSQDELAEKIGVSRQTLSKYETGESLPDIEKGKLLAEVLDVSLDDLVNYDRENSNNLGLGVPPKGKHVFGITKVGEKGQIVIPAKARKIFDIQPGDNLILLGDESQGIAIIKEKRLVEILNGNEKELILLAEALHEKKISDIADKIVNKNDVKVVLIAGPSSSGKTTFAKRLGLQLRLNGLKPVTISVDNYFVEREDTPKDVDGNYDFEDINAIDMNLFNDQILKLLNGEEVETPSFNFHTGHKEYRGEKLKLNKNDVLVIEGIHCLNDKLTESIPKENKFKIYISALTVLNIDYFNRISTTDSRLIRRIVRDYQFRGYSALHTLRMWPSVNRGEEKNIFPYQEQADVMFNTSLVYEMSVLKTMALPLLKEIDSSEEEYSEAKRLCEILQYFKEIPKELIPTNSLLREFLGNGDFKY